jgi:hypothetical protein
MVGYRLGFGREWELAFIYVGPAGPGGPLGLVPAHGPRRAYNFRAVLGRHYGLTLQPSPAQRRARAGPGPITSCWARARVGPKSRALGRPMGLVLFGHLYRQEDLHEMQMQDLFNDF